MKQEINYQHANVLLQVFLPNTLIYNILMSERDLFPFNLYYSLQIVSALIIRPLFDHDNVTYVNIPVSEYESVWQTKYAVY